MLKIHRPVGENSYYHPVIISTITCAALMRVQLVSVKLFIVMVDSTIKMRILLHVLVAD